MAPMVHNAPPRRADHILEAVRAALDKRRSLLNNDPDLQSVTVVVRLPKGGAIPRSVQVNFGTDADL